MIHIDHIIADIKKLETSSRFTEDTRCVYPQSVHRTSGLLFAASAFEDTDVLVIAGSGGVPQGFDSKYKREIEDRVIHICPLTPKNIALLRSIFPETAPQRIGDHTPSFGTGDRLGIATPGHIEALRNSPVSPFLAQQSVREISLMKRSFQQVVDDASRGVFISGFDRPWGADGDHVKDAASTREALEAGCTMITMDLSDQLEAAYLNAGDAEIKSGLAALDSAYVDRIIREYSGAISVSDSLELKFDERKAATLALVYGKALQHARDLCEAGRETGRSFDIEISIDETGIPTSPEAHYFVARELQKRDVPFTSIAPRFIGEFQKGIDYLGDRESFRSSFRIHAEISRVMGHKTSIHSGSDKFSIYPIIAEEAGDNIHVKTAGTSWLIALEAISRADPDLFRKLYDAAYQAFPRARTYYVISPDLNRASEISAMDNNRLSEIFTNPTDRQVLHVSYGELMKNPDMRTAIYETLRKNYRLYRSMTGEHIHRHLSLLGIV